MYTVCNDKSINVKISSENCTLRHMIKDKARMALCREYNVQL